MSPTVVAAALLPEGQHLSSEPLSSTPVPKNGVGASSETAPRSFLYSLPFIENVLACIGRVTTIYPNFVDNLTNGLRYALKKRWVDGIIR